MSKKEKRDHSDVLALLFTGILFTKLRSSIVVLSFPIVQFSL